MELSWARVDGQPRHLTVLVTPDQWERVLLKNWNFHDYFVDLLGPRRSGKLFLVFWDGDLERSIRAGSLSIRSDLGLERQAGMLRGIPDGRTVPLSLALPT